MVWNSKQLIHSILRSHKQRLFAGIVFFSTETSQHEAANGKNGFRGLLFDVLVAEVGGKCDDLVFYVHLVFIFFQCDLICYFQFF